jgi:CRISPR-associated protein Csd1
MRAVLRFLDSWQPKDAPILALWEQMASLNVVFKLDGDLSYIHERPEVKQAWLRYFYSTVGDVKGMCLVTGIENTALSRLHAAIKGVPGTQTSGAALVSFNLPSFTSFGKNQNLNAPIGEQAAFAYTTALNHLLARNSLQKVRIGDATAVFWTESASPVEALMAGLFDPGILDTAPDQLQNDLRIFLESVSKRKFPSSFDRPDNRFYILGLSPNAARISVRFWHVSTVGEIAIRIGRHYRDLAIVKNFDRDPDHPSLWQVLRETAAQRDSRNITPVLSGQMVRSLLTGTDYPRTILTGMISRIRADKQVNYIRAAMLKAYLIRNLKMEVTMSLDTQSTDQAYRLGRLFAVMEKAQEEAVSGASATIKDRFFGAASATPGRVFPVLLRGVQNNIAKLRKGAETGGRAVHFERIISEIMDGIDAFRPTLRIEEQGMFAIGYYHQRKALFTKKTATESKEE